MMYLLIICNENAEIYTFKYKDLEDAKSALKEGFYAQCHRIGVPEEEIEENSHCCIGNDYMFSYIGSKNTGFDYASKIEAINV